MHHAGCRIVIHPTAILDPAARIGADVSIGPYAVIGAEVEIGDGCEIGPHVVIEGPTRLGPGNRVFQFASIGSEAQDKKYAGERVSLEIGARNTVREYVTINRGTVQDEGVTRLGDDNWIMTCAHIAHDCVVGDRTVFANGASLAGHVRLGDDAILGAFTLVHQFCRIGAGSISALGTCIRQDVPPFLTISGNPAVPHGINSEGLRRRGVDSDAIRALKRAYRLVYKSGLRLDEAISRMDQEIQGYPGVDEMAAFLRASDRGIIR